MRQYPRRGHAGRAVELKARGIIDQAAEFPRFSHQPRRHIRVCQIAQHQPRPQLVAQRSGVVIRLARMDHNRIPRRRQSAGHRRPQASRPARHQYRIQTHYLLIKTVISEHIPNPEITRRQ